MDNILIRNIRHTCRNRLFAAIPLLAVGIALIGWLVGNGLIAAVFHRAMPFDLASLNVDALGARESVGQIHLPVQTISLALPAGYYQDSGLPYTDGEAATADYYLITQQANGLFLFIVVDHETYQALAGLPAHRFIGCLRRPSPALIEYLKKEYAQEGIEYDEWMSTLTTYQLDTTRRGSAYGLLLLALALACTAGGALLLWTGLRPLLDPHSHSVYRRLQNWGDADVAPARIQQEVDEESVDYYTYRRQYLLLTSGWLLQGSAFSVRIYRGSEIIWVYNTKNVQSFDDVPTDRSHVNICFAGKRLRCPMRIDLCQKLLQDLLVRYPSAIYGYTAEREAAWRANPAAFADTVRKTA